DSERPGHLLREIFVAEEVLGVMEWIHAESPNQQCRPGLLFRIASAIRRKGHPPAQQPYWRIRRCSGTHKLRSKSHSFATWETKQYSCRDWLAVMWLRPNRIRGVWVSILSSERS